MIAIAKEKKRNNQPAWHADFLDMLPAIQRHARIAFRGLDAEAREEAVQEATANAAVAYARLAELGKCDLAFPTVLSTYAVAQGKDGRQVGTRLNVRDVTSRYAQRKKGIKVERLDRYDREEQGWQEILVEDKHAGPAEIAATRIDFADWLRMLTAKQRRIANMLATGESTTTVAKKCRVTAGRISQVRRELMDTWEDFVGEQPTAPAS